MTVASLIAMSEPAELPVLGPLEQRVLGCLLEKQVTVPASYPLTLNALRTACNQSSSRDPVMDLDERTVETVTRDLRERDLIRVGWADHGRRTRKYHQLLDGALQLADDERALITVLLLRGAQSAGELRTRTERLHPFGDRDAAEACLQRLAGRPAPLVRQLERRPGQQDHRWVHLLGPIAETAEASPPASVNPGSDREEPLEGGAVSRDQRVRSTYSAIAAEYAARFGSELDDLPFERWLLDRIAAAVSAIGGPVADAGCGPGHITAYLCAAGVDAHGIDLTPAMIEQARRLHPGLPYEVGDLTRLIRPGAAAGWAAVLGWYSLIHLAGSELPGAIAALARPLLPGGLLVLGLHAGSQVRRVTSWLDHDVEVDVVLHDPAEVVAAVEAAGLTDVEWYLRNPVQARAETTERFYLLARRPL